MIIIMAINYWQKEPAVVTHTHGHFLGSLIESWPMTVNSQDTAPSGVAIAVDASMVRRLRIF